jgi:hypothetical protein
MQTTHRFSSRLLAAFSAAAFVALAGAGVGCSNNSNNTSGSSGSFYGMYTDSTGVPGTITLTSVAPATTSNPFGSSASTPLTGKLDFPGVAPINLSGSYVTDTGALTFTSVDDAYAFTGQVTGGTALGTSTGPNGAGSFVLFANSTSATVAVFCGTGVCTAPTGCKAQASFNLAVSGGTALMTVLVNGTSVPAAGSHIGDNVSFHATDGGADVTINGVINGSNVGGTWSDANGGVSGTWNGNTFNCSSISMR